METEVPIDDGAEQAERRLLGEYTHKLTVDGHVYPDPATFEDGWESEESGRFLWPSINISDISEYLKLTGTNAVDLVHRLLNNYKEGKAYRYYTCEHVREIAYHPIRSAAPICILRAMVKPSMTKKPYKVWVMVSKKTDNSPGGDIKTAHCTCPAGLLGSCNHIVGLLFRVEAAVKSGATVQSPTDATCMWVVPSGGPGRKPGKWRDNHLVKDRCGQKKSTTKKKDEKCSKKAFQPFTEEHADALLDTEGVAQALEDLFLDEASDSVFILTRRKQKLTVPSKPSLPETVHTLAESSASVEDLVAAMTMSAEEIKIVEEATRSQSDSSDWTSQCVGRITSSIFYNVHTKVENMKRHFGMATSEQSTWLVDKILGKKVIPQTFAMKHGLSLEASAKRSFIEQTKSSKQHKKWTATDCGLVISKTHPFLATSPDLLTHCECCGEGLCEVKCPESIKHTKPTVDNVPYLHMVGDQMCLKETHTYYGQVQGQMALTGRSFCSLFVYTENGSLTIPVAFDEAFWLKMFTNLEWYWTHRVVPELLNVKESHLVASNVCEDEASTSSLEVPMELDPPPPPSLIPAAAEQNSTTSQDHSCKRGATIDLPQIHPPKCKRRKKTTQATVMKLYRCGVCSVELKEQPTTYSEFSVQCEKCPEWYHLKCVNIPEGSEPGDDDVWICLKCQAN